MDEYQIVSNFSSFMISNSIYQLGTFVLLWAALRGALRIYDQGGTMFAKIISSLFGLGIAYQSLMIGGFFFINWQSTSYALSQLDNLSANSQRFVDFLPVTSPPEFSLIPWNPVAIVWWIVVVIAILGPIWMKKPS